MSQADVVIVSGVRTAIGTFGGSLKDVPASELGATVVKEAVRRAHATVGRAIWIATSIVVAGFILLSLSRFVPTAYFGIFTALAMVMGQVASLSLLPALFLLLRMPRS